MTRHKLLDELKGLTRELSRVVEGAQAPKVSCELCRAEFHDLPEFVVRVRIKGVVSVYCRPCWAAMESSGRYRRIGSQA